MQKVRLLESSADVLTGQAIRARGLLGGRPQSGSALLVAEEVKPVTQRRGVSVQSYPPTILHVSPESHWPTSKLGERESIPLPCITPTSAQRCNRPEAGPLRIPRRAQRCPPPNHGPPPAVPGPIPATVNAPGPFFLSPTLEATPQLPQPAQNSLTLTLAPRLLCGSPTSTPARSTEPLSPAPSTPPPPSSLAAPQLRPPPPTP